MRINKIVAVLLAGMALTQAWAREPGGRPFVVGHMGTPSLCESSGIVESRRYPGVFWTHNDSGNEPIVYAIRKDGSLINQFPIKCLALDWEDIAIDDDGHLYLGDIGNNGNVRGAIGVTMIAEPDPNVAPKKRIEPIKQWLLTFANGERMDCESLFVWKGEGYIIKKAVDHKPTTMWRFSLEKDEPQDLSYVSTVPINAIVCAADLSRDGDQLAVMTPVGPQLFSGLQGDPKNIERCSSKSILIEQRTNEGICITKGGLMGTDEQRDVYWFPFEAFAGPATQPAK